VRIGIVLFMVLSLMICAPSSERAFVYMQF
jgi:hypothetical protein